MQGYTHCSAIDLIFFSSFLLIFYILSGQATASWNTEIARSYQRVLHPVAELSAHSQWWCIYHVQHWNSSTQVFCF